MCLEHVLTMNTSNTNIPTKSPCTLSRETPRLSHAIDIGVSAAVNSITTGKFTETLPFNAIIRNIL